MRSSTMDGSLGLFFVCPVCGQQFGATLDFSETPALVVACIPCQTRFSVRVDGTVAPLNRDLPEFQAIVQTRGDD
jgi:transcription elongation factor Elf1